MQACFECGAPARHAHHVIPRVHGGTRAIPLCEQCHGRVHNRPFTITALTTTALAAKRAKGEKLGGDVPYGFRVAADGKALVPDATEQALLETIRTLTQQGLSQRAIVSELAQRGVTTRKGTPFILKQVQRVIGQSRGPHTLGEGRTPPMAKKGRPFTYQSKENKPVTISLRIPKELHTRLERYRKQHRQSLSELVKDGIEMRLETEADPRNRRSTSASPQDQEGYYGNTAEDSAGLLDGASILRDMQATLARHETQMHALMQAIARQTAPADNGAYDSTATMPATDVAISYQEASYTQPATLTDEQRPESTIPATVPAFDTTKFYLGKLCPKGHDFAGTGMSLLRKHNQSCRECENEGKREKRKAQRQEVSA